MNLAADHTIAIVAYDGISLFHLSIPCSIFGENLDKMGVRPYKVVVCTQTPGLIPTLSGFPIDIGQDLTVLDTADTVIVPAWLDPDVRPSTELLESLRRAHKRGARMVGLCLGSFVLAEAGLLDGRTASTHWVWGDDFARKYPEVIFDNDVLYIDDGDVLTSAGAAAAIDCCLHLLRRDHGADVANQVARRMVVAPHRSGGQVQYIEQPLPRKVDSDRLEPAITWAIGHLSTPINLDQMADRANMSRRNFSRLFRKATGITFTHWLLTRRLALAQRLLETNDHNMELVASAAGFSSSVSFRQHFSTAFSISPTAYRKQFRQNDSR